MAIVTFTEGGARGSFTTTGAVVVPAPTAGRRLVRTIVVSNPDTQNAAITLYVQTSAGATSVQLARATLKPDRTLVFDSPLALAVGEQIVVTLDELPQTTNPGYVSTWGDAV